MGNPRVFPTSTWWGRFLKQIFLGFIHDFHGILWEYVDIQEYSNISMVSEANPRFSWNMWERMDGAHQGGFHGIFFWPFVTVAFVMGEAVYASDIGHVFNWSFFHGSSLTGVEWCFIDNYQSSKKICDSAGLLIIHLNGIFPNQNHRFWGYPHGHGGHGKPQMWWFWVFNKDIFSNELGIWLWSFEASYGFVVGFVEWVHSKRRIWPPVTKHQWLTTDGLGWGPHPRDPS